MKMFAIVMFTLIATAGGVGWYVWDGSQNKTSYRFGSITRGDVTSVIAANGVIQPEEVIDVGAQVQGKIEYFGRDPNDPSKLIEYGTKVEPGTILAQIDNAMYASQVEQAKANLQRSEADLKQWEAKVNEAERDWVRKRDLNKKKVATEAELDIALSAKETAQAMLGVGKAAVSQAKAALTQAEISLSYTTIKSPVKGQIIDRRVNIGQTVVASFNAPSLFLIAKDLTKLQVWVSVNEADIGRITVGQKVSFTVDAFPRDKFEGVVSQVRYNAQMTQNVVTYTVVVSTNNPGGKLIPYLTANVQFLLEKRENVLTVPNVALRWRPKGVADRSDQNAEQKEPRPTKPTGTASVEGSGKGKNGRKGKPDGAGSGEQRRPEKRPGTIWVQEGDEIRSIEVQVGLSDGANSEISGESLTEGLQVITGEVRQAEEGGGRSPFAPQGFRGGRGGGGGGGRGGR